MSHAFQVTKNFSKGDVESDCYREKYGSMFLFVSLFPYNLEADAWISFFEYNLGLYPYSPHSLLLP